MELNIETFKPTTAELRSLVAQSQDITLPDPFDQGQLRKVKDARLGLRDARVRITKLGKELRDDALKFQRSVIAKEKELVGIIEPEEDRLAALEDSAETALERAARKELLPHRRERLAAIGDAIEATDDELLGIDGPAFEAYCNKRLADKNEADRLKIEAEKKQIEDEKAELARKRELAEAEERGRREAEARAERDRKEREEREERERKEAAERAERERKESEERSEQERKDKERQEREERERLEREERYQDFLKEHGYSEENKNLFHIDRGVFTVTLYKLAGVFDIHAEDSRPPEKDEVE